MDMGERRSFGRRDVVSAAAWGAVLTASLAVAAMWGPWFRSGAADRNSFGLFRAAQVLGIEWVTPYRVAWFLLPVVLVAAVAFLAFGATRSAAAVAAGLGAVLGIAGGSSVLVIGSQWGAMAATAAGTCTTVLGGAALILAVRQGRSPREQGRRPRVE